MRGRYRRLFRGPAWAALVCAIAGCEGSGSDPWLDLDDTADIGLTGGGSYEGPLETPPLFEKISGISAQVELHKNANPPGNSRGEYWTPVGMWGADGDMDQGGGYKSSLMWDCLICDGWNPEVFDLVLDIVDQQARESVPFEGDGPTVLYLSADDSNSQASPVLIRSMIDAWEMVPPGRIRVWEILNYLHFDYPAPSPEPAAPAISVHQQLRPFDIEEGIYALQIGIASKPMTTDRRRPLSLTLSLDLSGSMSGVPIMLLRYVCTAIASQLREGDLVSIVTWNSSQAIVLDSLVVSGPDDPELLETIWSLATGGSTDLHGGLVTSYALAEDNFIEDGLNRVVLISDGGANTGVTDENVIAEAAAGAESEAVYLVGVGVGSSATGCNDNLMDTVTDLGKGASLFVDSFAEAYRMFGDEERFLSNMELAALDVQVEITLPPTFEMYEFFGEEYSEDPEEVEPQHVAPNESLVIQQMIRTSTPYEVDYEDTVIALNVTYTDAQTGATGETYLTSSFMEMLNSPCEELRKGDGAVVFAQALGKIYEYLEDGDLLAASAECAWATNIVEESAEVLDDEELVGMAVLLNQYCVAYAPFPWL